MHRPRVILVTPALAAANNGNWQTAQRWARMLGVAYRVTLTSAASAASAADLAGADAMLALHARRSAASISAWREQHASRALVVVLTGTDLYRDIEKDTAAQRSLLLADRLVVLNEHGLRALPAALHTKTRVVLQSSTPRQPVHKTQRHLQALMVGHLREEKDPHTYWRAAQRLKTRSNLRLDHIGGPLDPELGAAAQALAQQLPHYRWLGEQSHAQTRRRIQHAHVLVHPSRMEGGAHTVIEALCSGTAVLASAIDGNTGLLGDDHPGLFAPGDDAALAALLERCRDDAPMLRRLEAAGARRAHLFTPQAEATTLLQLMSEVLAAGTTHTPQPEKRHERPRVPTR